MAPSLVLCFADAADAPFAGRTVSGHLTAVAARAGIAGSGPGTIALDARFASVSATALAALVDTLPDGGALHTTDGTPVAYAHSADEPWTDPGGTRLTLPPAQSHRADDAAGLSAAERAVVRRFLDALARSGVHLVDPARTWIEPTVRIAPGCRIWPDVTLRGQTVLEPGAEVQAGAWLVDTRVGERSTIRTHTVCDSADIGPDCAVGPMAHLRPGAVLRADVKVGNFVEVKKSVLHTGVRASHLTYLGDAEVGAGANIGAGTITCNYDGWGKYRTTIGPGAFIGSNTALVAPVTVGKGAIVGAGSVIAKSVPDQALALERAEQRTYEGRAPRLHERNRRRARRDGDG